MQTFEEIRKASWSDLRSQALELGISIDLSKEELLDKIVQSLNISPETEQISTKNKQIKKRGKKKKRLAPRESIESSSFNMEDIDIEYIVAPTPIDLENEAFKDYLLVFEKFAPKEIDEDEPEDEVIPEKNNSDDSDDDEDMDMDMDMDMDVDEDEEDPNAHLSKKKLRKLKQMKVYELKARSKRPDLVEWVDATAADPEFLVYLKSLRNIVPVPRHWGQKKKYLQGKRGVLKKPFELPSYIRATGIMEMRDAIREKEDSSKLKTKAKQRMQPKMGKLDIDYQKLHDAFFKYQTKPPMSIHGDLYYEGKEFEANFHSKRPGDLSEELKSALNMPPNAPAPWLINMQRYGPPPSYPNLKIPGLNAPLPPGAQWGYHPGGWGKPPVDEYNRPLYGDVFGVYIKPAAIAAASLKQELWGELEPEEDIPSSDEGEQEEEDMEIDEVAEADGFESTVSGLETPTIPMITSGHETPDFVQLRKESNNQRNNDEIKSRNESKNSRDQRLNEENKPKDLYTVIKQKDISVSGFMGSQHVYDLTNISANNTTSSSIRKDDIQVSLNPDDLENGIDGKLLKQKYDAHIEVKNSAYRKEDLSDMVADHSSKQSKKKDDRKKKDKDFKF